MAITRETAEQQALAPAVTCCRNESGTLIEPGMLEDPAIFAELEETGILTLGDDTLRIQDVLGARLTRTLDALMPITKDDIDAVQEQKTEAAPVQEPSFAAGSGQIVLRIGEGKNIEISIPALAGAAAPAAQAMPAEEPKQLRSLTKKYIPVREIRRGDATVFSDGILTIREGIEAEAAASESLVEQVILDVITKDHYDTWSETIMDVQPIAIKEEGKLGEGTTRVLDGAVLLLTGTDSAGAQIGEFGSSEGELARNIMWNRPGAPDTGDILLRVHVVIQEHMNMERPGPLAAHKAADRIAQEIRDALKAAEAASVSRTEILEQVRRPGRKKVLLVKEIMGQGAMHDNLILPSAPVGTLGGKPNVDLGNVPIMLSPLEVLDGGIHALTCIGPASKETSRHYFREPLVTEAMADEELSLCGVLLVGSPQINTEKFYVSERLGMTVEAIDPDGVIITTEGFGNNHIDFAAHHEEVGRRGIPVVGVSYSAVQGALVVGNEYMTAMVDLNKSMQGIENEILANNTLCNEDALRALAMLKNRMAGEAILPPERSWNAEVKEKNLQKIEQAGQAVERVPNEQILPKSRKRAEIYEKEA